MAGKPKHTYSSREGLRLRVVPGPARHTAENKHALFTRELFPIEERGKTLPVNMSAMFGHYKRAAYHSIFQEDLCWKGIRRLINVSTWKEIMEQSSARDGNHSHRPYSYSYKTIL